MPPVSGLLQTTAKRFDCGATEPFSGPGGEDQRVLRAERDRCPARSGRRAAASRSPCRRCRDARSPRRAARSAKLWLLRSTSRMRPAYPLIIEHSHRQSPLPQCLGGACLGSITERSHRKSYPVPATAPPHPQAAALHSRWEHCQTPRFPRGQFRAPAGQEQLQWRETWGFSAL